MLRAGVALAEGSGGGEVRGRGRGGVRGWGRPSHPGECSRLLSDSVCGVCVCGGRAQAAGGAVVGAVAGGVAHSSEEEHGLAPANYPWSNEGFMSSFDATS